MSDPSFDSGASVTTGTPISAPPLPSAELGAGAYALRVMDRQRGFLEETSVIEPRKSRAVGLAVEFGIVLGLGISLALCLHMFVTQVYAISGQSMEPTLSDGERVVISKLSPTIVDLSHGDVIIFQSPHEPAKSLIKRVIGLPGDRIEYRDGRVFVNGRLIEESYIWKEIGDFTRHIAPVEVGAGELYVMGDNRPQSQDSRDFGPVSIDLVKGKVFLRLWPLSEFEFFP